MKHKILFVSLILSFLNIAYMTATLHASENIMKIHDITAQPGDTITIELEIINSEEFVAFNLDVPVPEGFTYVPNTAQLFRKTNHMFAFNIIEETNLAKIIAFSISNDPFTGNEGVVFSFDLETPDIQGEYDFEIQEAIIGNIEAADILTATIDGLVTLVDPDQTYQLVLNANPEEGGELEGADEYNFNDNVEINAVPNLGWVFENWTNADGDVIATSASHAFTMPANDLTLTANFSSPENIMEIHDVTANAGNNIRIDIEIVNDQDFVGFSLELPIPDGFVYIDDSAELLRADDHHLDFTIDENNLAIISASSVTNTYFYDNEGVILRFNLETPFETGEYELEIMDGGIFDADGNDILTEAITGIITLLDSDIEFELTLLAEPFEGGNVDGGGHFSVGEDVTVHAIANDGWFFTKWTNAEGAFISDDATHDFQMPPTDLTLIAHFEEVSYSLALVSNPEGAGNLSGDGNYKPGTSVVISAEPNENYQFIDWRDMDDEIISTDAYYIYPMPVGNATLTANFKLSEYELTLLANPSTGGEVFGEGIYHVGEEFEITAEANLGYLFANWTDENGTIISHNAIHKMEMPPRDLTLTANFNEIGYDLFLLALPEEGGEVAGIGSYNYGEDVEAQAMPNEGWEFESWTDAAGEVVSEDAIYTFIMPASNVTLTANFTQINYTLSLIAEPQEGGEVQGDGVYNFGVIVDISAVPNDNWEFVQWTNEDGGFISDQPSYSIEITGDMTMIAHFIMTEYTLTLIASPEEGGEVVGDGLYNVGEEVEINALPADGWAFVNWTDDNGETVSENESHIIIMPAADLSLTANFELRTFTLTFVVTDMDTGETIDDAVVRLEGVDYPAGYYVFENLEPRQYDYLVSMEGYLDAEGSVDIVDTDITVEVMLEFDDGDTSVTGIDGLELKVFPNPVSNILNIESNENIISLQLIDMQGQLVYSALIDDMKHEITVDGFYNGYYLLKLHTLSGVSTRKIFIVN